MSLRDVGWVWEGQGIDPGVPPSMYGLGQGTRYFGLSRAISLFHPTDEHALGLMSDLDEVACSMLRYGWEWDESGRPGLTAAGDPDSMRDEGERIARLSERFKNITGAFCDDLMGVLKKNGWGPDRLTEVMAPMRDINPGLKVWSVVYTHEFEQAVFWAVVRPHIDVVNLWVWGPHKTEITFALTKAFRLARIDVFAGGQTNETNRVRKLTALTSETGEEGSFVPTGTIADCPAADLGPEGEFQVPTDARARYVRLVFEKKAQTMTIGEVRIWGFPGDGG